jgi:hypothetical protein
MTQPLDEPVPGPPGASGPAAPTGPPSPPGPPSAPPPRASWVRRHLPLAGLAAALVVVAAIAVTVVVSSSGRGGGSPRPGQPLSSTAPAPQAATVTGGARWLTGRAGKLLAAVNSDLGTLSAAERAGRHDAAKQAGRQLVSDVRAALSGPMPPVRARDYRSALAQLQRAGAYAADGDAGRAAPLLMTGGLHIAGVAAAVNMPGGQ